MEKVCLHSWAYRPTVLVLRNLESGSVGNVRIVLCVHVWLGAWVLQQLDQGLVEARIVLGSDSAFAKAKEILVNLWNNRANECHEIEVREYKETRSTKANAFYWAGVVTPGADQLGYLPDELHHVICCALYGTHRLSIGTTVVELPNRTTTWPKKMNVEEFNLHIERACALLAEQGISIDQSGWRE